MFSLPGLSDISGAPTFGGAAAPSSANGGTSGLSAAFDSSGWTVNTGSGSASGMPAINGWLIGGMIVAGLVAWKISKR